MTEKLGRYEILEKIGQGGFAVVYRARDTQLDRLVALKELKPMLLTDPDAVKNFHQEARNIARLDHPHVVTIYDVYETQQRQFIVMQLVDGPSLAQLLATQGPLLWSEAVEVITALAVGLDYAHSRDILHRDLKPANILLNSNHRPMLSDFGLAKLIGNAATSITASGGVVGTPNYIAPEVWEGQGTTRQSDIYALGCILYEMLVGEKLFAGDTPPAVMMAHFRQISLPQTWPEGVPPGMADVLAIALAQKAANRYATAAEMAGALAGLTASKLTTPSPEPAPPVTRPVPASILTTKLYPPPTRPEFVRRPRLIEHLNDGLQRKLTLISAPAGFGKTTLVSNWIYDLPAKMASQEKIVNKVAWLSLDEGDNDPIRFLTYLVAALQTIAPAIGAGVLGALQSPQPPSTESILTALLNEINTIPNNLSTPPAIAEQDFVLVLDDYHLIEAKPVDQALTFLLDHLPARMHLVITTREDPNLPLARYRARGQLVELRVADLRFTPSEAAAFLNQAMGLTLSAEDIAALENRTEGWIAGLQLAALSIRGQQNIAGFIKSFAGSHRFIMDYLVEEVLHQQPQNVQTFLLCTSILDRLCGPLCDAVLGREEPQQSAPHSSASLGIDSSASGQDTLEYLEQANLFVIPLDNQRHWYRYHHLFADVLRAYLLKAQPNQVSVFHLRASRWYEQNNLPAEAIRHALAAEDFDRAADLIELLGPAKDQVFQSPTWLNWVQALPDTLLKNRPVLKVEYAWTLLGMGKLEAAEAHLKDVECLLNAAANKPEPPVKMVVMDKEEYQFLPASIAAARTYHAQALGDIPSTIKYAQQALDLYPEDDYNRRGAPAALLGIAQWASGDLEAAGHTLTEVMAGFQMAGNIVFALSGTYGLADIRMTQGRLREAITVYRQSLQLAKKQGQPAPQGTADLYLGLGELHHEQGKADVARQYLQKSEDLGEQAALPDWPFRAHLVQARIKQSQGDLDGAVHLLDQAERLYYRSPVPVVRPVAARRARVWIKQGKLVEALAWAREQKLTVEDDLTFLREFEHITLARVLVWHYKSNQVAGSIQQAMSLLARLLVAAKDGGRIGSVIEILMVQALAHKAQGDLPAALEALEQALMLAQPEGYVQLFVDEGQPMAELLSQAAAHGLMPEYTGTLLAAFPNFGLASLSKIQNLKSEIIEPLSDRELEVLQLIAQGLSNHEIGERLFLALSTVKGHNRTIFGKLQVKRRTEAVARARELGLL